MGLPRPRSTRHRQAGLREGCAEIGLINKAVPFAELENEVARLAEQMASIPVSQLSAMKLIVNQAYENMGLASTQMLGPILDGLMRNTPEALEFIELAEKQGVGAVTNLRDSPLGMTALLPRKTNRTRTISSLPETSHPVRTGRGDATRSRLLEAARAELLKTGGALEIANVAARAKVSPGLLYHDFGAKDG